MVNPTHQFAPAIGLALRSKIVGSNDPSRLREDPGAVAAQMPEWPPSRIRARREQLAEVVGEASHDRIGINVRR